MTTKPDRQPLVLSDNARTVLERRYLARDANGNLIETPEQLFRRVADNIAQAEERYTREAPLPLTPPAERGNAAGNADASAATTR
jgi:ribonucleotide reductase alpha subunit